MKKTLVASALVAVIFVPSVSAIEVYKDDKNAVEIGGFVDARIINTQGVTEIVNGASRINFGFTREMSDGWKVFTKLEWGVNPFGNSEIVYSSESNFQSKSSDFLNNRLGYVGIAHDVYGSLTIGKQWSTWYDVVYNTNYGLVWDGNASGTYTYKADGGINGTGRGDDTVQYRNSVGDLSFGVQVQLKHDSFDITGDPEVIHSVGTGSAAIKASDPTVIASLEYNNTYGGAATYNVTDNLIFTAGFNIGEFKGAFANGQAINETDSIYGLGAMWGNWNGEGVYAAFNVNKQEYHDTDNLGRMVPEATGLESLVSYKFNNGIRTFASYNILEAGDDYESAYKGDEFKRQFAVVGVHYVWDANTVLYLEGRKDYGNFTSNDAVQEAAMSMSEEDGVGFGVRYIM
ncbi:porin [Shewanella violacea]|uniref:Outer membrane porin, putative n=1 Tax=Shewanella violacea (strain JCM 10179 / CIP 106290 / LMG 19151 / DSS12) TaxID=637905 RepID=D4ZA97_SHEVD|nr:porin [Shewanella violacea]BAJ02942.1 outer membrane porin, putative [Shewanella violacea DSS12]